MLLYPRGIPTNRELKTIIIIIIIVVHFEISFRPAHLRCTLLFPISYYDVYIFFHDSEYVKKIYRFLLVVRKSLEIIRRSTRGLKSTPACEVFWFFFFCMKIIKHLRYKEKNNK
jgi:hypothetical protein